MRKTRVSGPSYFWIATFGLWAVFLSGAFASVTGSPGVIQALRLRSLLSSKQAEIADLRTSIARLERDRARLDKSAVAQEREIRRVLGYAANDELIFDFNTSVQ